MTELTCPECKYVYEPRVGDQVRCPNCYRPVPIMYTQSPKPPLGLMPRKLWVERRITSLCEAIKRYRLAQVPVPHEWIDEFVEHLEYYLK